MMYVIYNYDGSIKTKLLNEFVMQGSSYENVLFIAFDGRQPSEYNLYATFKLPNGDTNYVISSSTSGTEEIAGTVYTGKYISISSDQTWLNGTLQMNVSVLTVDTEKVLVSFSTYLTINETGTEPDDPVIITAQEYQNLISEIGSQVLSVSQVIFKASSLAALGDLTNWQVGQAIYIKNANERKLYDINQSHEAVLVYDFSDHYTKSEIATILNDYYTKTYIDNLISGTDYDLVS